jgi:hypothetical protein
MLQKSRHRFGLAIIEHMLFIYGHGWELMKSVGSHGSLLLLFVMKGIV